MTLLKIYASQTLQNSLKQITTAVQVTYFALEQPEADTLTALDDLAALTPYLSYQVKSESDTMAEADRVVLRGQAGGEMVFVGAPLGTELAALVSVLIVMGRAQSGLGEGTRQRLAGVSQPVQLEIFTSPT